MNLSEVLPAGFADNDLLKDMIRVTGDNGAPVTLYRARKAGQINGSFGVTATR